MSGWSGMTGAAGDTPAGSPAEAGGGTALKAGPCVTNQVPE